MPFVSDFESAIEYIEENLTADIDFNMVAQKAKCSTYTKIIDIALKYGYDSHSSFTRAFQLIQGVTPSKARIDGVPLMAYPPLTFQFILKGVEAMQYKIVETQPYKVFGMDVGQTDGWTTDKFFKNSDRVIENGSHDTINITAGFPGLALEMIAKNEWDVTKIHLLQAIHFWDEEPVTNILCIAGSSLKPG